MKHSITIPSGRKISVSQYAHAWRELKKMPPETEIPHWNWYIVNARDILVQMSYGVHDRINKHLPWHKHINSDKCAIFKHTLP